MNVSFGIYWDELNDCVDTHLYNDFKTEVQKELSCNATFDGHRCWPRTAANTTAYRECPAHYNTKVSENESKF